MVYSQQRVTNLIDEQKKYDQVEKTLRSLSERVLRHHILLKQLQLGDQAAKNDWLQLQMAIVTDLQTLQQEVKAIHAEGELGTRETILIKDIFDAWQPLSKNPQETKSTPNEMLYNTILQRINTWMLLIGNGTNLLMREPLYAQYFIDTSWTGFPHTSLLLDSTLIELGQDNKTMVSIGPLQDSTQKNILSIQKGAKGYQQAPEGITLDLNELQEALTVYNNSADEFFTYAGLEKGDSWSKTQFLAKEEKLVVSQYALWNSLSKIINQILQQKLDAISKQRAIALPLMILFLLAGLLLLLVVAMEFYIPLHNIIHSMDRFAKGDMGVRSKIFYEDEVGNFGKVLNRLSDNFEHIIGQLHRTGIQLTTSTTEIAAAAKQQEITVVEQEATTKEIAVTAGEISATAKEFAKTMNSISQTAEQTSSLATSGKDGLTQMEIIMRQMVDASANIASRLGVLNEKASGITTVVTTIAKVADQTNLLSLNASIEAEKAGEMGRSFAVIAREIRRLADQTANATVDIEKMVNEMISAASSAVMGVDKFTEEIRSGVNQVSRIGEVLSQIIEQVQGLTTSFENVNLGMRNQTLGAEQINEAIIQLSDVAQQTSASIRQFHNAIEQLNIAARDMQSSASKIKHT